MTTPQRTTLIIAALIAALAALLLPTALANAQEPPEASTTLHPGVNLVGWVGEATPVSQLFDEIPQLESIWAWDAELRDWIVAGRAAPEWLGGLGRVTAGMGLRMHLGGDQPYLWQRSTEPTRGLVKLRTGWNLVAWSGADQTPIDDALKGIGWSLRAVRRWNAGNQEWTVWTSPERSVQLIAASAADQGATGEEAEPVTVRRGEALWIEVARAVNWLQPTDILPRLVFPGGASQQLQARVQGDLESVLAFYRTQYGIQADPDFTIYVPKDVDALIQAYAKQAEGSLDASAFRESWKKTDAWVFYDGGGGREAVIKRSSWDRYTLTHEYSHVVQHQLSGGAVSQWLLEGTASWVEDEHRVLDRKRTWRSLRSERSSAITRDAPTLRSTEYENAQWEYTLGWLATDQLASDAGSDSWIEFWHRLTSTMIGSHGRWTSTLDWRTAFHQVFGQSVSEFYVAFNAWQSKQPRRAPRTGGARSIRGRIADEAGAPVAGVFVNAIKVNDAGLQTGWNQRAETAADGTFAVRAPENGDYRLSVDINDCTLFYSALTEDWVSGWYAVRVAGADVRGIDIQLPSHVCGHAVDPGHKPPNIRGRAIGPNDEPISGLRIVARRIGSKGAATFTAPDGSFAVPISEPGEWLLQLHLTDFCRPYYSPDWTFLANFVSPKIIVDGADVNDILIEVPEGLCWWRVAGHIVQPDGEPFANRRIWGGAWRDDGTMLTTDDNGSFVITVLTGDEYNFSFDLDGGCTVYVGSEGLATSHSPMRVAGRDVRLGTLRIPAGACRQITGRLTTPEGLPVTLKEIEVCRWNGLTCESQQRAQTQTDQHGSFAITVSADSSYGLSIWIGAHQRNFYFSEGGFAADPQERPIVSVEGHDVHLGVLQVPTD